MVGVVENVRSQDPRTVGRETIYFPYRLQGAFFNVTMAVLAGHSWTGLVVKNSYVASQHFNEDLVEARRQAARGWTSKLVYGDRHFAFTLKDRSGQPVPAAVGEGHDLARPYRQGGGEAAASHIP